ncbi:DNA replication and repair protein RecF [Phormidesmis priestleyi ULC007]|uniref:DNA replication and repair protein RecF n=1 Tax=Phormidesmis priestleyi ULC007 TaxID=1920490 RepID=A0A2T1DAV1_9CYAN|nr:DNA replication/repair protein RecF [Phormidesmis priestleyi]PSB17584.1 DNA replication and repair protein RecF [Phormidesmis priestleyi ULC007]PZO48461.1 MAG: DNA replication and repair protein RecF [Phormidesmis priestleyi]
MYLKTLHLRNFRNYPDQQVEFSAAKTILVGNNAQGKSNLLEAVELMSSLRSHRTSRDRDLILDGEAIAQISGHLQKDMGEVDLSMTLRQNGRRSVGLNGLNLRRQLDFLGTLNMVQFSSLDLDLVRGGPEQRRHWLDALLVQLEPIYASVLQQYNQILRQRNALLKSIQKSDLNRQNLFNSQALEIESQSLNPSELSLWDAQLAIAGSRVIRRRARVLQRLIPFAQSWHQTISGSTEALEIRYAPNVELIDDNPEALQKAFLEKIQQRAIVERHQGTTIVGPHRDEVEFTINNTPARQYGSQGQQRTLVLALKLAELKLIEDVIGEPPLLLLDDVLAELDLSRQNQLLDAIQDRFQTLITTTHLGSFDAQWINASQILEVKAGQLVEQEIF